MVIISNELKQFIESQKLGYVGTVSPDNTPNVSPKGTIIVWNQDKLIFADIKSPNTISNLQKNPSIEINVVDPIKRRGYRFKGKASILQNGSEYDQILTHYKEIGIKSEINCLVMINVEVIKEITSPLYDLGYSEEQVSKRWKEHFLKS